MIGQYDLEDVETTSDKQAVKVLWLNEAMKKGEPMGRFLPVEDAFRLEAQGECSIVRKKDPRKYIKDSLGRVQIRHLLQENIDSYGEFEFKGIADAELGDRVGKWKIVRTNEQPLSHDEKPNALTKVDVFGPDQDEFTRGVKKKLIAWVQDSFIRGGAEISSELVMKVGRDCGYRIKTVTHMTDPEIMAVVFNQSDLLVINNIWGFSAAQMQAILEAIYSNGKPYVKYEHDHRELDRLEFSRRLFQNSKLNVFLSPIHLKNHQERLGCEGIALPLAIDVDLFKPVHGIKREENTAMICNVRHFKSWVNLQKYIDDNQKIRFTVMAETSQVQGSNVTTRQMISPEKMPELYSEFEYVIHLLDGWGAGERVIFEGVLCGCKIVANEKVGHMSWNKDLTKIDDLRDWLVLAPYSFWQQVERKILY